mgnify:CR=1 FL=1
MVAINFYGTGIRYWVCAIPNAEFDEINMYRLRLGIGWEEIFFSLEVLEEFGYSNWENIHLLEEGKGWLIDKANRFEIKSGRKKRLVTMAQFIGEGLLFEAFTKKIVPFKIGKEEGITYVMLSQIDAGLINKYHLESETCDLDKLCFTISILEQEDMSFNWLSNLTYNDVDLFDQGEDCLTRSNRVILL